MTPAPTRTARRSERREAAPRHAGLRQVLRSPSFRAAAAGVVVLGAGGAALVALLARDLARSADVAQAAAPTAPGPALAAPPVAAPPVAAPSYVPPVARDPAVRPGGSRPRDRRGIVGDAVGRRP